jgi:carbonic anhydrase
MTRKHLLLGAIAGMSMGVWRSPARIQAAAPETVALEPQAARAPDKDDHAACKTQPWSWNPKATTPPAQWTEKYPACGIEQQAPINFDDKGPLLGRAQFNYKNFEGVVENTGYKVLVKVKNPGEGGGVTVDGRTYPLIEFHLHTESEHTVRMKRTALEAHLVHQTPEGRIAAVGVLYDQVDQGGNGLVRTVVESAPQCGGTSRPWMVNPSLLFAGGSAMGDYWEYPGSLTNPECSRIDHFMVSQSNGKVTKAIVEQFARFVGAFPNNAGYQMNNRPPQKIINTTRVGFRRGGVPLRP